MNDCHRCSECEALISQEWDLCEDCHSNWMGWLMAREMQLTMEEGTPLLDALHAVTTAAYAPGRTPDIASFHPGPLSGWLPDTDGPEGTPF